MFFYLQNKNKYFVFRCLLLLLGSSNILTYTFILLTFISHYQQVFRTGKIRKPITMNAFELFEDLILRWVGLLCLIIYFYSAIFLLFNKYV